MKLDEKEFHSVMDRTYVRVWAGLIILTGVTVSVAGMNLGRLSVLTALIIAAFKAGLVLNYFMHLKYERGLLLFRWMIPGTIVLLAGFIGFTFFDIAFR